MTYGSWQPTDDPQFLRNAITGEKYHVPSGTIQNPQDGNWYLPRDLNVPGAPAPAWQEPLPRTRWGGFKHYMRSKEARGIMWKVFRFGRIGMPVTIATDLIPVIGWMDNPYWLLWGASAIYVWRKAGEHRYIQ